jgi:Laminin B (Domain IV)/Laminin EGF domain
LTYTVRYVSQPSGAASRSNSPNVVIVSGNEITLHHYRQDNTPPFGSQTFNVPIFEENWQHYEEGKSATRQHLLMTLANVTAIYIKATYTTVAEEAALSQVSLDVAKEQNYGSNQRAWEVEQCNCPTGHEGLSCEDCSQGYYKGDQGLYLGLCEPCECNGHSEDCDPKTGVCRNCRDNTFGDNCDLCLPGFSGNATYGGCQQSEDITRSCNSCNAAGTASCDPRSRSCNCKPNVSGYRCDQCRDGTFGLSESNPYGCNECFENEISYDFNDDTHIYFWNLPDRLTGNLILSYGGKLTFTQRTDGNGQYVDDQDIIIKGNGITLTHSKENRDDETYSVKFVESEWQTLSRQGVRPASRADLLTVLSNVDSILIRASLRSYTNQAGISDITLDTSVRQPTALGRTTDIEACRCPPGYKGTSCEQCDANYYRDVTDRSAGLLGTCKVCPCDNAESCQMGPNKRVTCNCLPGFGGEFCRDRAGK